MSTAEPARTYRSGPLSIRTSSGPAPRSRTIWSSIRVLWSASIERATRIVAGVFVDDGEQFQRAAVAGGVELEVQGPDMVGRSARSRLAGMVDSPGRCRLRFRCRTGPNLGVQLCRTLKVNGGEGGRRPRRGCGVLQETGARTQQIEQQSRAGPFAALSQSQ
jgi:hypothetical protein